MTKDTSKIFTVRPMKLDDLDDIAPWFEDPDDLSLFDHNCPAPMGLDTLREYWKADLIAAPPAQKAYWYIARNSDGKEAVLGGLRAINYFHGDAVLPIFVAPSARHQGLGLRMTCLLLDLAFDRLHLTRVTTYLRQDNEISSQMIRKAAFREEGRLRKAWRCNGRWLDMIVAGVLREEWANHRETLRAALDPQIVLKLAYDGNQYAWPGNASAVRNGG
jgi:RimJ/RimL family protein N-acetyltransferase